MSTEGQFGPLDPAGPGPNYHEIPLIELRVGASPESKGRVERYDSACNLMHRLDRIGRDRSVILAVSEAGQPWQLEHVDALNHYLHAGCGLRSFKRVCVVPAFNKYGWAELRERLLIPALAIIVTT